MIVREKRNYVFIQVVPPKGSDYMFDFLCELFNPFIDSIWLAATTLFSLQNKHTGIIERNLVERAQWFGEKCYFEGVVAYFDATSKECIRTAFKLFDKWEVITTDESSAVHLTDSYELNPEKLKDLVEKINSFRRVSSSPPVSGSRLGASNFPVLARL